ncbi:hypothetical protein HB777_23495 [Mesorhizobium loti]|nr:hypothetical protein HB777_23495 [Mesorhizobium loti]
MSISDQIGSPGILQGRLSDCIARRTAVDEGRRTPILNLSLFRREKHYLAKERPIVERDGIPTSGMTSP